MTKEYIIKTCDEYGIENYTINTDLSIDVNGGVYLDNKDLTKLPLIFNIVDGNFYCDNNKLTSLKGSPRKCKYFLCYNNELTNLEGAPGECEIFNSLDNKLTSLKGAPRCKYIAADYDKLNLDNEELYVIEALANNYDYNKELKDYLKTRQRNEIINILLNDL